MPKPYLVTLDFGSTSAKCLIFDAEGNKLSQVKQNWHYPNLPGDQSDQTGFEGSEAWRVISACCNSAIKQAGISTRDIACVIPTSQRHGAVVLDKAGDFLFSFTNADFRSGYPWDVIAEDFGDKIYHEAGRWPQKVFLPAHLFWLNTVHPEIHDKVSMILGIQDWLIYQLSGEMVSEWTVAGDLLLMNVNSGMWSPLLTDYFDVPLSKLPPLVQAGEEIGRVSRQAAEATGLLAGTPVLNGAADSQLALLGLGALSPRDAVIIFGTSIPILYLTNSPSFHPDGATWTNRHTIPGYWVLESNSGDGGLFLNLFRDNLLPKLFTANQGYGKEIPTLFELDALAEVLEQKKTNLIASWGPVIFHGKKWPVVNGTIKGFDLQGDKSIGWADLYLSLIENSGLAIRGNLNQLIETAGSGLGRVFLGGPAVESRIWQRLLPGMLGTNIFVPDEKEITPLGAAVLAASKIGVYDDIRSAVTGMVRLSEITPDKHLVEFYQERYQDWLEVYNFSLG